MCANKVYLAAVAYYDHQVLEALESLITGVFGVQVEGIDLKLDLANTYSPARQQYSADKVMMQSIELAPKDGKVLVMVDVDLFVPIFTFIFGQAQLAGHVALLSTWRLRPEYHGGAHDKRLFMERLFKEALHELGHAFGLKHCYNPGCVMNFSPTVEHVDEKTFKFCPTCERQLHS